jgi:hypothetical protein
MTTPTTPDAAPWWHFGHVWLVVSGPTIVVLASFFTFYLAYAGMDALVTEADFPPGGQRVQSQPTNLAPAMQARNHAATGVAALPAKP